jgi:hypothetical protein
MKLIDTFPTFLDFWEDHQDLPLEEQIDGWAGEYLSQWSELLHKQVEDYEQEGYDWRQIARERIFPNIAARLPTMVTAYEHLSRLCEPVFHEVQGRLDLALEVVFVIHVGIGNGAGWATTYDGSPAVLFGLENIAEESWDQPDTLTGLIAHEVGHLAHFHWREAAGLLDGEGPWWQLYTEGFAQYCEGLASPGSWHMNDRRDEGWLEWCSGNKSWLAERFQSQADSGAEVREFFGSWYALKGFKQCGYFLGYELIREMSKYIPLMDIALLKDYQTPLRKILESWSE